MTSIGYSTYFKIYKTGNTNLKLKGKLICRDQTTFSKGYDIPVGKTQITKLLMYP
jgi:hypothetical protein